MKLQINKIDFINAFNSGLTNSELAKKFSISVSTVKRRKAELKLSTIKNREKRNLLIKDLILKNYSDAEIGKILNLKGGLIYYIRINILNIKHKDNPKRLLELWSRKKKYWKPINSLQKGVLLGTLLGDGNLVKDSSISARGSFTHCLKQKEYALFKKDVLYDLVTYSKYRKTKYQILNGKVIKPTIQITIRFKSSPYLLNIYNKLYINNKKKITKEYLDECTAASLAMYYFDDGYLSKDKTGTFSMYSFSKEERILFVNWLKTKFNILATQHKDKVRIRKVSANKFFELIKPYCTPCIQYKLPN